MSDQVVESWTAFAACRGADPDLWFSERGESTVEAKEVCASCPVREECLDYALDRDERFGVWGGLSYRQRRQVKARRRRELGQGWRDLPPIRHGTDAGYMAHRRREEHACGACLAAHSIAQSARARHLRLVAGGAADES